jgi:hypothetical protein
VPPEQQALVVTQEVQHGLRLFLRLLLYEKGQHLKVNLPVLGDGLTRSS